MTNYMENLTKNLDAMYAGKIGSAILKQDEYVTLFFQLLQSENLPLYMVIIHMTEKFRLKSLNFSP